MSVRKTKEIKKSLVSIVIPVFNTEKYLRETLDSVLDQTYDSWEIICIDDGSSDKSIDIINEYHTKDNRIQVYRRTCFQKGGSVCRNLGAKYSSGKYLIFLDSDDCLSKHCLECRVSSIEETNSEFVVFPVGYFSTDLGKYKVFNKLSVQDPLYCFAAASPAWQTMQAIIRRDFFEEIGGFDEKYQRFQDIEFYFRALLNSSGKYIIMNNQTPDCFFRHDGSSGNMTLNKLRNSLDSCCYLFDLVKTTSCALTNKRKLFFAYCAIISNFKLFSFALDKCDSSLFIQNSLYLEVNKSMPYVKRIFLDYILRLSKSVVNAFVLRVIRKGIDIILYRF